MAILISEFNTKWNINEDDIIALTRDEVFDMLEDCEDNLLCEKKALAMSIAKKSDRNTQDCYESIAKILKKLDKYWTLIQNSAIEEFYISKYYKNRYNNSKDAIAMFETLSDNLIYKGNVISRTCTIEFSLKAGATVNVEMDAIGTPAYMNVLAGEGAATYIYDKELKYDEAVIEAKNLNQTCRFFKCKNCGKIAYISKEDDERKQKRGLQPVQRCLNCIRMRRSDKLIQDIRDAAPNILKAMAEAAVKEGDAVINAAKVPDTNLTIES